MKKLLIVVAALLVSAVGFAQAPGGMHRFNPEEMAKFQVERMKEPLSLTQEQSDAIYSYLVEQGKARQEQMQNGQNMSREEMRASMQKSRAAQLEKFKTILTEEQMKKYEEMMAQFRHRRQ